MRVWRLLAGVCAVIVLSGCAAIEANRMPVVGNESAAGVGDPVYRYELINPNARSALAIAAGTDPAPIISMELLYSGLADNQIRLTYREFQGGLARPAFTQEAQYDYKPGEVVVFKGAQIRVIEAQGSMISYVVERGFTAEQDYDT